MNSIRIISIKTLLLKRKPYIKMMKSTTEKRKNKEKKTNKKGKENKDKNNLIKEKQKYGPKKNLFKKRFPPKMPPTAIPHLSVITKAE
jgi:hypothetical protein